MISMLKKAKKCQAVPNRVSGIVVAADVSKGKIDFGAFRPDERSKVCSVKQDQAGFGVFLTFVSGLKAAGYQPWIAFEPTGPYSICFRELLLASDYRVVQVNGYHVKRTKEVRDNSPAKSDSKDPQVIADLVWQGCYQELAEMSGSYAELRAMSAEWASLTKKRTALKNEFQSLLEVWFPEIREAFKDVTCQSVRGLVKKYKSPRAIAIVGLASIESTLGKASLGRTIGRSGAVKAAAVRSIAPCAGAESRRRAMICIIDMLDLLERRQKQLLLEMQSVLWGLPEAQCMLSLHGVGTITVSGLLGECGNIGKYETFGQLEKFVGLNLYEISSGKYRGRKRISKRGRALARYLICAIALSHCKRGGLFEDYAKILKSEGKTTGKIRVAVARKLLRVLYAVARDRVEFDPRLFRTGARTEDGPAIQQGAQANKAA